MRILLADDHQLFREALRSLLGKLPHIEVVAETGNGLEVMGLVRDATPDIVCMDISMPGLNGIETTRRIIETWPNIKVIALSGYTDQRYVMDMMAAGASAYVTKAEAGGELLRAIEAVSNNHSYLCPDAMDSVKGVLTSSAAAEKQSVPLGPRERQVLALVAAGHTSIEIAEQLHIAASTIEVHRRNIMRKLDVHSVAGLTRYAIRSGLISD